MLKNSGSVKFNFTHFLLSSPSSENDQKYEYFLVYWSTIFSISEKSLLISMLPLSKSDIFLPKSVKYVLYRPGPAIFSLSQTHKGASYMTRFKKKGCNCAEPLS